MNRTPHSHQSIEPSRQLAELAAQLAKLSAEMVGLATLFLTQNAPTNRASNEETADTPAGSSVPLQTAPRPTPASKAEVLASVKAARDVIGQFNRPVQISVLYKEISDRGFAIRTSRPILTYGARLRDYRKRVGLTYLDGFGWWLTERPYPAANHTSASITRIGKHIA